MRRGLIAHSTIELPDAALDARLHRVRAAMAEAGLDALVVYSNNTQPAGVSWLCGFVPYWSEALLVVPRQADPYLVVALTYRVKSWIERTSRVAEVIHTPRIGRGAAHKIAEAKADAAVGVVDLDGLAAGIVDDLREAGARLAWHDAGALFARVRAKADPAEIALAVKAASIAHSALAAAAGDNAGARIAAIDAHARKLGAEEIYVAAAPNLAREHRFVRIEGKASFGEILALRATVAYKGVWVRLVRTFGDADTEREAIARLAQAVALLPSDRGFAGLASWRVEGCRTTQPLDLLMDSRAGATGPATVTTAPTAPMPGALVSVQAALAIDGRTMLVGGPVLLGGTGAAASLLVNPLFD